MNLIEKWKDLLEFSSDDCPPVPREQWKNLAEMLEFTERATLNKPLSDEEINKILEDEKENGGYFYQTHNFNIWAMNKAKFDVPRVRIYYKNLSMEDLFLEYL